MANRVRIPSYCSFVTRGHRTAAVPDNPDISNHRELLSGRETCLCRERFRDTGEHRDLQRVHAEPAGRWDHLNQGV